MKRVLIVDDEDDIREVASLSSGGNIGLGDPDGELRAGGTGDCGCGAAGCDPDGRDDAGDGRSYDL